MSEDSWQDALARGVLSLQILVGAMFTGCLVFLVIALVLGGQLGGPQGQGGQPVLTVLGLAVAGIALAVRMVVPRMLVESGRRAIIRGAESPMEGSTPGAGPAENVDAAKLGKVFQTKTIAGAALFEGPTFLLLVAYLIEQSQMGLIAALLMMAGIALHFPTRSAVVHWVEDQLERVRQERG